MMTGTVKFEKYNICSSFLSVWITASTVLFSQSRYNLLQILLFIQGLSR